MRLLKYISIGMITTILITSSYAGSFVEVDGKTMYANDYGEFAKSTWVWIDTNNDSIAECYRFNADGTLASNYKDSYGKKTNDKGQLVEGSVVVQKMLSSGEIISGKKTPVDFIGELIGNIINPKKKTSEKDKLTGRADTNIYYEKIPESIVGASGSIINNTRDEVSILMGETAESGIIYAGGKDSEIGDNVSDSRNIVAGKDLRKFISGKSKCTEKVNNAYIYGGAIWNDAIQLSGNNASIKLLLDGNNYIRFEVAHQSHGEETKDTDLSLDMYVDDELYASFDSFVDGEPETVEEYLENGKVVELKVNIKSGSMGRRVYIRNGRLRKIKVKD